MTELKLIRKIFTEVSTIGELFNGEEFLCYAIEDKVRPEGEAKVYGKTAIPYGRYKVVMTLSNRFKVVLPLLVDVPGFAGVRIHSGNTAADSSGCLIVGLTKGVDFVGQSKLAMQKIVPLISAGETWLTIVDGRLAVV